MGIDNCIEFQFDLLSALMPSAAAMWHSEKNFLPGVRLPQWFMVCLEDFTLRCPCEYEVLNYIKSLKNQF